MRTLAEGEHEAVIQAAQGKAEAIRLVNKAAEKYFVGNAQALKKLEMVSISPLDSRIASRITGRCADVTALIYR